jgi:hypothetical protein
LETAALYDRLCHATVAVILFSKLLLIGVVEFHRVREAIHLFVEDGLGPECMVPLYLNPLKVVKASGRLLPLIFIIDSGMVHQDKIIAAASLSVDHSLCAEGGALKRNSEC